MRTERDRHERDDPATPVEQAGVIPEQEALNAKVEWAMNELAATVSALERMTGARDWYRERRRRALEVRDALIQMAEEYYGDARQLVDHNEDIGGEIVEVKPDMTIQRHGPAHQPDVSAELALRRVWEAISRLDAEAERKRAEDLPRNVSVDYVKGFADAAAFLGAALNADPRVDARD